MDKKIELKMPEKIYKKLIETRKESSTRNQRFFMLSRKLVQIQRETNKVEELMTSSAKNIDEIMKQTVRKLKIDKQKNYNWMYDGKDGFVGTLIEKKEEVNLDKKVGE